jgi:hypothetical protein
MPDFSDDIQREFRNEYPVTDNQTPESGEQDKLLIFGWITTVLGLPENGDPTQYNKLTDKLYELRTTATQASNKALLSHLLKDEAFTARVQHKSGGVTMANTEIILGSTIRDELAALERQQLGKESKR